MSVTSHVVGAQTEFLFFSAMQAINPSDPRWFLGVRRANRQEDHNGIDAFASLDVGEVPIQIKSSLVGLEKFVKDHPRSTHILVIVIGHHLSELQIRKKVFDFLYRERGRIIGMRVRSAGKHTHQ